MDDSLVTVKSNTRGFAKIFAYNLQYKFAIMPFKQFYARIKRLYVTYCSHCRLLLHQLFTPKFRYKILGNFKIKNKFHVKYTTAFVGPSMDFESTNWKYSYTDINYFFHYLVHPVVGAVECCYYYSASAWLKKAVSNLVLLAIRFQFIPNFKILEIYCSNQN